MSPTIIRNFLEFDNYMSEIHRGAIFRGVSDKNFGLLPSLFRKVDKKGLVDAEATHMWLFKTHGRAHVQQLPQNDLEWLVLAQHHGLPTRLLDWSLSPLVALYFAVHNKADTDAAVYILKQRTFFQEKEIDINDLKEVITFIPSHHTKRVAAQQGVFSIHPLSIVEYSPDDLEKIIIPASQKMFFLQKLISYGINHATIFPDLDGVSKFVTQLYEN